MRPPSQPGIEHRQAVRGGLEPRKAAPGTAAPAHTRRPLPRHWAERPAPWSWAALPRCDKAYDSKAVRGELRRRRIQAVISRKGSPNIKGLGKLRYVVEQTFALLHQFKRLAVRCERRIERHDSVLSLACSLISWRRLKKTGS